MATNETYDVIVWGNNLAACWGACASAKRGARTAIVYERTKAGGIISNGLGAIDGGRFSGRARSWMQREYFKRLSALVGSRNLIAKTSPSASEEVLIDMLNFYGVYIRLNAAHQLDYKDPSAVTKAGASIVSVQTTDGSVWSASRWLDCTEEGDLAKAAGCTMVKGREAQSEFGETLAGFWPVEASFRPFDCYDADGVLLPTFEPYPTGLVKGDADHRQQSYAFRMPLTKDRARRSLFRKPEGYDEDLFAYRVREGLHQQPSYVPIQGSNCLHGIVDQNGDFGQPYQNDWADATLAERAAIFQKIYTEQAGWLWFLQNDESVHPAVRSRAREWGLANDELRSATLTQPGWPEELYIRDSRRLRGQYVMTEHDLLSDTEKSDVLSLDFYSRDFHPTTRYAVVRNGVAGFIQDGFGSDPATAGQRGVPGPYQRPFRIAKPLEAECDNLLVPVACSSTSVAMSSMRIDVHKGNFAAACGWAAAKSKITNVSINALDVTELQADIVAQGQFLSYTPPS